MSSGTINTIMLKSGFRIPVLGMGTWRLADKVCEDSIKKALELGYRHIDTAELYANESDVGRAISGYEREELFITSKVWRTNLAHGDVIKACQGSLRRLGTSYLDLYLIHWPIKEVPIEETLGAMHELVEKGMVRSVGISNFNEREIKEAVLASKVPISVNQIEFHPYLYQASILEACGKMGIAMTAFCPLARGKIVTDDVVLAIAKERGKTAAQVGLRWIIQHGGVAIPKSTKEEHLRKNMDVFDWSLSEEEMERIDTIEKTERQVNPTFDDAPYYS